MSKHTIRLVTKGISYGHDNDLGYWYDVHDYVNGVKEFDYVVDGKSTALTNLRRGDFLDVLIEYGAPESHIKAVSLDTIF